MRLDLNAINEEIALGNVNRQVHPRLPLAIYKYSQQCVFARNWNETTLLCRGIVLDDAGEVVINSFPKFFNYNEGNGLEAYTERKNSGMPYEVTDKMDGSLIQVARYKGQVVISSSGSFTSPQAMKAVSLLAGKEEWIDEIHSYLFEIIYPDNRIVLNYGDKVSLTLLAIRHTETGVEFPLDLHKGEFETVQIVDHFVSLLEIENELKKANFINKEGYIVKFADGYRVKMKYDEYMRLHKIVSGVNEKYVWECLRDGVDIENTLVNIPDELFQFVKDAKAKFQAEFDALDKVVKLIHQTINKNVTRKEQAEYILRHHKEYAKIIFSMLDGRDYSKIIWNSLEPEFKPGLMGMGQSAEA